MVDCIDRESVISILDDLITLDDRYVDERLEIAIATVKRIPSAEVIPLGVELWADRFEIKTRDWRSADGDVVSKSFVITRREK